MEPKNKPGISPETMKLSSTSKRLLLISLVFTAAALVIGFIAYQKFARNSSIHDALNAYRNQNFDIARKYMSDAYPLDAQHVKFLEFMALSSYRRGIFEEAEQYYKKLAKYHKAQQFYRLGMVSLDYFKNGAKSQKLLNFKHAPDIPSKITYGYSLIAKGDFLAAKQVFEDVLMLNSPRSTQDLPGIEECAAAYNGLGVAIARSKEYKNLKIAEYRQAISAFQAAIAYKLPYTAPYANLDRILATMINYAAAKFKPTENQEVNSYFELFEYVTEIAGIDVYNFRAATMYYDDISWIVNFKNSERFSDDSQRINELSAEPLYLNRVKYLFPEIAVLMSRFGNADELNLQGVAEDYWTACENNFPEDARLKYLHLNSLLWNFRNHPDEPQNADSRAKIKKLLSEVINSEFFKNISDSAKKKIHSAQPFFNKFELSD